MSENLRRVEHIVQGRYVMEGAGVRLRRALGGSDLRTLDPFLLLDDFKSDSPEDYIAGFPWHPHRGMETVTYMIHGEIKHEDSLGNTGVIGPGDVQWMTAGGGIIHQEMPHQQEGLLWGFQLWVNLPAADKMGSPRYREITAGSIPRVPVAEGGTVGVIAGALGDVESPAREIAGSPRYLDVRLEADAEITLPITVGHTAFAYVFEGAAMLGDDGTAVHAGSLAVLAMPKPAGEAEGIGTESKAGEAVAARAGDEGAGFLLISGRPINEPIVWYGPFVMNTQEEIEQAMRDYRDGTLARP